MLWASYSVLVAANLIKLFLGVILGPTNSETIPSFWSSGWLWGSEVLLGHTNTLEVLATALDGREVKYNSSSLPMAHCN